MKLIKKAALLIACLMLITACVPVSVFASLAGQAKAILIFSASTVTVGENVNVTVKYTADTPIGSWNYELNYDASKLEYVSGADSGGSGTLNFVNSVDKGTTSISQTVTFRATNAGDSGIRVNTKEIIADNGSFTKMSVEDASATMHIKASPSVSGNADLGSLTASPGTLTPAFSSLITDYSLTVSNSVTYLDVNATAYDSAASVSISNTSLAVGVNTVSVTVTAGNGVQKLYRIAVTRLEAPAATAAAPVVPKTTVKPGDTVPSGTGETTASALSDSSTELSSSVSASTDTATRSTTEAKTTESYSSLLIRAEKAEKNLDKARILLAATAAAFVLFIAVVIIMIILPSIKARKGGKARRKDDYDGDGDGDGDGEDDYS